MNPSDILIFCCHLKRNLFFEDTMRRLYDAGFKRIWIQQTGTDTFGHYGGPCELYFEAACYPALWDAHCLVNYHNKIKAKQTEFKYIFLADFDLFLSDVNEFKQCLDEIEQGHFDHVSRFKVPAIQKQYDFGNQGVIHVPNVKIGPGNIEYDWPDIDPHFATGFEFFSHKLWTSLTSYDLSDGRRYLRTAVEKGMKLGAHRAEYGTEERCWGKEWFHVSNLSAFYRIIDSEDFNRLDPSNTMHLFKLGLFAAQEECYGNIYPKTTRSRLEIAWNLLGGRDRCLEEWNLQVTNTCMKDWKKL